MDGLEFSPGKGFPNWLRNLSAAAALFVAGIFVTLGAVDRFPSVTRIDKIVAKININDDQQTKAVNDARAECDLKIRDVRADSTQAYNSLHEDIRSLTSRIDQLLLVKGRNVSINENKKQEDLTL